MENIKTNPKKQIKTQKLKFIKLFIILSYFIIFIINNFCLTTSISFAADPKLISTLNDAFEKIEKYILKLINGKRRGMIHQPLQSQFAQDF